MTLARLCVSLLVFLHTAHAVHVFVEETGGSKKELQLRIVDIHWTNPLKGSMGGEHRWGELILTPTMAKKKPNQIFIAGRGYHVSSLTKEEVAFTSNDGKPQTYEWRLNKFKRLFDGGDLEFSIRLKESSEKETIYSSRTNAYMGANAEALLPATVCGPLLVNYDANHKPELSVWQKKPDLFKLEKDSTILEMPASKLMGSGSKMKRFVYQGIDTRSEETDGHTLVRYKLKFKSSSQMTLHSLNRMLAEGSVKHCNGKGSCAALNTKTSFTNECVDIDQNTNEVVISPVIPMKTGLDTQLKLSTGGKVCLKMGNWCEYTYKKFTAATGQSAAKLQFSSDSCASGGGKMKLSLPEFAKMVRTRKVGLDFNAERENPTRVIDVGFASLHNEASAASSRVGNWLDEMEYELYAEEEEEYENYWQELYDYTYQMLLDHLLN